MNLKQFEALAAVSTHGKFTTAAAALDTVQSNISSRISRLEDELGAVLVDRGLGQLTPEGEIVMARVGRINAELRAIREDVSSMTDRIGGDVRLGTISTPARWLIPALLDTLSKEYPDIEITTAEGTTTSIVTSLRNDELDLGIINIPVPHPRDDLVNGPLWLEQMVVVAPSDHELAAEGDRVVTFQELAKHELLRGTPGTGLRVLIDKAAAKQGVELRTKAQLDGIRMSTTLAFQGYGPAIVPITSIPDWANRGNWNVLTIKSMPPRVGGLVLRRKRRLTAAGAATRQIIRDVVREIAPQIKGLRAN